MYMLYDQDLVWLFEIMSPFGLAYFRAYIKQLMQINKFLCIIYKFLRLFMKKQFMKIRFSLVRAYKFK